MASVFWDYYTEEPRPRNLVRNWYATLDVRARTAFDATLSLLETRVKGDEIGAIKQLTRDCAGLWEVVIDLKDKKPFRHIRPIGIWEPNIPRFVLLGGFEKSGRIYTPNPPCAEALKYKAEYEAAKGVTDEHH